MAKSEKKKVTKVKVNFSGTPKEMRKHTERSKRVPEGDYLVKVLEGNVEESEKRGTRYINWKAQIVKPKKHKGAILYGMTSLKTEALWNLRNLIHAATGKNVAGKAVNLDTESIVGKIVGAAVEDDEYKKPGTKKTVVKSRINTWFPKDEYSDKEDEDEDDEDADVEEEEDEDDEDSDDEDEDEEDEDDEDSDDEDLEDVDTEDI